MRPLWPIIFLISGCNYVASSDNSSPQQATCKMDNFKNFPKKVTGPVTLELKTYITILIENKDKTEKVEMTFLKSKCGVK
jgi:hypothetical protein